MAVEIVENEDRAAVHPDGIERRVNELGLLHRALRTRRRRPLRDVGLGADVLEASLRAATVLRGDRTAKAKSQGRMGRLAS